MTDLEQFAAVVEDRIAYTIPGVVATSGSLATTESQKAINVHVTEGRMFRVTIEAL